jgi:hypothetical protein
MSESSGNLSVEVFRIGPQGLSSGEQPITLCVGAIVLALRGLFVSVRLRLRGNETAGNDHEGPACSGPISQLKDDSNRPDYFVHEYYLNPIARTGSFPSLFQTC